MTDLTAVRAAIAAKRAERQAVGDVNALSKAEAEAVIDRYVDGLAVRGSATVGHAVAMMLGGHDLAHAFAVRSAPAPAPIDLGALLAAVLGAAPLKAALKAHLADVGEGLPRAERVTRLAEIEAQLFALEVTEERLVCEAEAQGLQVQRRADARAEIVLALPPGDDTPAAAPPVDIGTPAAPTSPAARRSKRAMPDASGWLTS